jgi:hypothetical protein
MSIEHLRDDDALTGGDVEGTPLRDDEQSSTGMVPFETLAWLTSGMNARTCYSYLFRIIMAG